MHEFKGKAVIKLTVEVPVQGQFNSNYRSGEEELEEQAMQDLMMYLPNEYKVDVLSVDTKSYELLDKMGGDYDAYED
jgi:hypothetical protein